MSDEFEAYVRLKIAGVEPRGAYMMARGEGMSRIVATRMLREVYGLDLTAAKEEAVKADTGGLTLAEYQGTLLPELREAFEEMKRDEN